MNSVRVGNLNPVKIIHMSKEDVMKTRIYKIILLGLIFTLGYISAIQAQGDETKLNEISYDQNMVYRYKEALQSEVPGVVESGIFFAVKLNLFSPELNSEEIKKELSRLVKKGQTETIRYKAYIAYQYLDNPELLSKIERKNYRNKSDEFFRILAPEPGI